MAIKCHSGFVHYNMFHDNHCRGGGNNYGSIFNITNNCSGGTSFWGGLGAGLGFGFGNLLGGFFGNMFGGFGNMLGGFGNMFGGFGMGGWGGGLSGLWGGGGAADRDYSEYSSRRSSRSGSCDCGCKGNGNDKKDIDNPKFASITAEIAKLEPGKVTETDYERIKKSLEDALEGTDGIQTDKDKETYENLLRTLENLKEGKVTTNPLNKDEGVQGNQAKIGGKLISELTVNDIAGITQQQYDQLSDADKNALKSRIAALAENERKALAQNNNLPADLRIAAKQSFYNTGYTNVDLDTLTDAEIKKLKSVIDTSNIADFENIKTIDNIRRDAAGKLMSFKMTAQSGTNVTYVRVSVVDGELIFHGKQVGQEYALQKDTGGNYHLMQYAYHKGNGTADVRNNS